MTYVAYTTAEQQAYDSASRRLATGTSSFANKENYTDDNIQTFLAEEKTTLTGLPNSEHQGLSMADML